MGFLLLRWKHWQCEELYTDIDCHLLVALIMTLTQMTIMRILELRRHIFDDDFDAEDDYDGIAGRGRGVVWVW